MTTISVGFSRPKTWKPYAKMIMCIYKIDYDHAYIRLHSDKYKRDLIYQASGAAVNFMGAGLFDKNNTVVAEYPVTLTDPNYITMMQFAIDNSGRPYGVKAVIGLFFVTIAAAFGKKISNPFNDNGETDFCTQLVGYIIENFLPELGLTEVPANLTPPELRAFMSKIGSIK
jgi:hypothetical protein